MPRISTPMAARPLFYDRSGGQNISVYNAGSVAPHATTTRWTYTVAADEISFLQLMDIDVVRNVAATTLDLAHAALLVTLSGGATQYVMLARHRDNAVGSSARKTAPGQIVLRTGDAIRADTGDLSTGGNIHYTVALYAHEAVL